MELNFQNIIGIITVGVNLLIGAGAIITNIIISSRTVNANKEINRENAGKNRKIYEIKSLFTGEGKSEVDINEVLNKGDYTILYVGQDLHNTRRVRYILGRVK